MFFLLVPLLISVNIPASRGADDGRYTNCSSTFFICGRFQSLIKYPFWGGEIANYCGLPDFQLICKDNIPMITIRSLKYQILHLDSDIKTLVVASDDYFETICPTDYKNITFDDTPFKYVDGLAHVTFLYDCPTSGSTPFPSNVFNKNCSRADGTDITVYYLPELYSSYYCKMSVIMPIYPANLGRVVDAIQDVLQEGFGLQWTVNSEDCDTCSRSGGQCGYDDGRFSCFCKDGPRITSRSPLGSTKKLGSRLA